MAPSLPLARRLLVAWDRGDREGVTREIRRQAPVHAAYLVLEMALAMPFQGQREELRRHLQAAIAGVEGRA